MWLRALLSVCERDVPDLMPIAGHNRRSRPRIEAAKAPDRIRVQPREPDLGRNSPESRRISVARGEERTRVKNPHLAIERRLRR